MMSYDVIVAMESQMNLGVAASHSLCMLYSDIMMTSSVDGGCCRAMQVLSGGSDIDLERELNKVYRMFLEGQANLVRLKGIHALCLLCPHALPPSPPSPPGEATQSARRDSGSLPLRVSNLCELLIFVKNLELSCTAEAQPQLGTK